MDLSGALGVRGKRRPTADRLQPEIPRGGRWGTRDWRRGGRRRCRRARGGHGRCRRARGRRRRCRRARGGRRRCRRARGGRRRCRRGKGGNRRRRRGRGFAGGWGRAWGWRMSRAAFAKVLTCGIRRGNRTGTCTRRLATLVGEGVLCCRPVCPRGTQQQGQRRDQQPSRYQHKRNGQTPAQTLIPPPVHPSSHARYLKKRPRLLPRSELEYYPVVRDGSTHCRHGSMALL